MKLLVVWHAESSFLRPFDLHDSTVMNDDLNQPEPK